MSTRSKSVKSSDGLAIDEQSSHSDSPSADGAISTDISLAQAREEILALKHAAALAQAMREADIRMAEEVLRVKHAADLERVKLEAAHAAELARIQLEASHAAQIKELELINIKAELQKERAMEHALFVQAQSDNKVQAQQLEMERQDAKIKSTVAGHSYKRVEP